MFISGADESDGYNQKKRKVMVGEFGDGGRYEVGLFWNDYRRSHNKIGKETKNSGDYPEFFNFKYSTAEIRTIT